MTKNNNDNINKKNIFNNITNELKSKNDIKEIQTKIKISNKIKLVEQNQNYTQPQTEYVKKLL